MTFPEARSTFREVLLEDDDLRYTYLCNIAMMIHDSQDLDLTTHDGYNKLAERLLERILDVRSEPRNFSLKNIRVIKNE